MEFAGVCGRVGGPPHPPAPSPSVAANTAALSGEGEKGRTTRLARNAASDKLRDAIGIEPISCVSEGPCGRAGDMNYGARPGTASGKGRPHR